MEAIISSKGQVTVPKKVRDYLHLTAGDHLAFFLEEDGSARLVPVTRSVTALKGCVPPPKRPLSLEEMDAAVARGVVDQ